MIRTLTFRLVLLLAASLPFEGIHVLPGSDSIPKALGILAAAAWLVLILAEGRMRAPHLFHVVSLLYVLWTACSMLWTVNGPATETRALTYAQLLVLTLVVWETVTTVAALRKVLLSYLVGCYAAALSMVAAYVIGGQAAEFHGRVTLGGFNPNDAGLILSLGMPVACYLLGHQPGRWRRSTVALAVTYFPLAAFGVLGTGSRAALAAVIPALWYGGGLLRRRHPAAALVGAIGLGALTVAVIPLLPTRSVQRLAATGTDLMNGNLNERQDIWGEAIRLIHAHPVVGIGAGAFRTAAVGVNQVGHNVAFSLLAEIGVVGFSLFVAVVVVSLRSAGRAAGSMRGLWYSLFAAWMYAALLHNWEYRKLTWLLFVLMVASSATARGRDGPEAGPERRTAPPALTRG
ncbi:MAG: O-antigen ligase family protein [Marmoricola sp.]